jgi:hypothetical protein
MTTTLLNRVSIFHKLIDERFRSHRLRAQRAAGLCGFIVADLLFVYRYLVNHIWSWDLLAVILTTVVVKLGLISWYSLNE